MGPIRPHLRWSRDPAFAAGAWPKASWPSCWHIGRCRHVVSFSGCVTWCLQDYRGTLLQVFCSRWSSRLPVALPRIVARVLRPGDWAEETTANFHARRAHDSACPLRRGFCACSVFSLGVIHGLPADPRSGPMLAGNPRRWAATAFQAWAIVRMRI